MADDWKIEIDQLEFQNVFDAKVLSDVAEAALNRVKLRHEGLLNVGMNPDGQRMKPLSPAYEEYKEGRGRNPVRDLSLTGSMLTSAGVAKVDGGAEYGFPNNEVGKARGNEDRSPFHYLSDKDVEIAEDLFSRKLDEGLKDLVKIKRSR